MIAAKVFKGRVPRIAPKLLPEGFAQEATNCDLRRGKLESMKGMISVVSTYGAPADSFPFNGVRNLIRINKDLPTSDPLAWLAASSSYPNANFVRAQIADSDNRIYATANGQPNPVQINSTRYAARTGWVRLGVVAPTTPLTVGALGEVATGWTEIISFEGCTTDGTETIVIPSSHGDALKVGDRVEITSSSVDADLGIYSLAGWTSTTITINQALTGSGTVSLTISREEDPTVEDTVSYVYTRVVKWYNAAGDVIQEEESAPSSPTGVYDAYTGLGGRLTGFVAGTDNPVTHFRVYRLSSGTAGAEFQYLGEITVSETEFFDDKYYSDDGGDVHEILDVQDDILETTDWTPPPDELQGLTQYSNGILAGFVGNKLYLSEPWAGYAWPEGYSMLFDYDIVALAVYNESLLVLTEGFPYVVTGLDPESMSQTILPYEQGCVSKDGVTVTNVGVIYPTPDGLFLLTANSGKLLTKEVFTKDQWAALPVESLISFFYDDQYYGFFRNTGTGFLFNFKENPYVVDLSISGGSITGGYLDTEYDTLFLVNGSALYSWGTGSDLAFTWKSAVFRSGDASNYACAAVVAEGSVDFELFADGASKHAHTVTSEEMFRLPSGYRAREFEFSLEGSGSVDSVAIGHFSEELF
jgi:hypothetical protein